MDCKKKLQAHVERVMGPIQERRTFYEKSPDLLSDILREGAEKAGEVARRTIDEVINAIGFFKRG